MTLKTITLQDTADWLPPDLDIGSLFDADPGLDAETHAAPHHHPSTVIRFKSMERRVFRRRKKIAPSAWAEKNRHIEDGRPSGPWKNSTAPWLSGIMDGSFHPSVEEIAVCKIPQAGVTEALLSVIGYVIDRDPSTMM
jgi:hypothetical protein